jgi:hypothetical protein
MDIDKALKAAGVNKGKVDQVRGELEPQPSDEPVSSPEIEGGRQMDMDKPLLKSFGSSKGNVTNLVRPLERVPSVAPQPSDDIDEVSDEVGFRPEQHQQWPMDTFTFLILNNVPFAEASVVKYVMRWREQGGVDELRKARRLVDMMIEMELNRPMYTPKKACL